MSLYIEKLYAAVRKSYFNHCSGRERNIQAREGFIGRYVNVTQLPFTEVCHNLINLPVCIRFRATWVSG